MPEVLKSIHAHMPYHLLPKYLDMIVARKLNLEIYFDHTVLDELDDEACARTAAVLRDAGLAITFHAPFVDLRPGALDDSVRDISVKRIRQALGLIALFNPLKVVCHACYDERYYVDCDDLWLEQSVKTWSSLATMARDAGSRIVLENVYETKPGILRRLLDALDTESVRFCFDTGHFNAFARAPLAEWIREMAPFIDHLHLHDNYGSHDEHLPIGSATFPFAELFATLRQIGVSPTATLEAHRPDHLWQSMDALEAMTIFRHQ